MNTVTTDASRPELLRAKLTADLVARGVLDSLHWREAFRAVPRHRFVSRYTVLFPDGAPQQYDLTDPAQHDAALTAAYWDTPLVTQEDDKGTPTSSSSEPSMMAMMLEAADLRPGMNVLEIGTGTGYNAALLTHALGAPSVTSVDLHPGLVKAATEALHREGYEPTVVCGDGGQGCAQRAPYDRIIATCAVTRIPAAWREQLKPGGVIVANIGFGLARLTLTGNGGLEGSFLDYASFMPMRTDVGESAASAREVLALADRSAPRRSRPMLPTGERVIVFLRSVIMPGVVHVMEERLEGNDHVLVHPESGSWVRALHAGGAWASVAEAGPRHLWTELEGLAMAWTNAGRRPVSAYGMTVDGEGEHTLWAVSPERHRWRLK